MGKTMRKIELMHQTFGIIDEKQCKDCQYFERHRYNKTYFKCRIYGVSSSEATDWAMKYKACGAINMPKEEAKKYDGHGIIKLVRPKKIDMPIEGQLELQWAGGTTNDRDERRFKA